MKLFKLPSNPWELLMFAGFFAVFAILFFLADEPVLLHSSPAKGMRNPQSVVVGSHYTIVLGWLSAIASTGLIALYFWVRHRIRSNHWRDR